MKTGIPSTHILTGNPCFNHRENLLSLETLFSMNAPLFYPVRDCSLTSVFLSKIGYGHIVPLTMNGKIFCIFYASCGIPFTLVFLSACVQRLQEPTFRMLAWMMSGRMGKVLTPLGIVYIN